MSVAFSPGDAVGRGDLYISLSNSGGNPSNAYEITYALYYVSPGPPETEVLIGSAARVPVNPTVGEYYAALTIPGAATAGDYRIRWTFKEFSSSPSTQVVQEFAVVASSSLLAPVYSLQETSMIRSFRIMVADNDPDRKYRFMPPEHEGDIGQYNKVFGQIFKDEEIIEFLRFGLDDFNAAPPLTQYSSLDQMMQKKAMYRGAVMWAAIARAALHLTFMWIANEFSYSIGGVSLDIEKSSKYEGLKGNAESQFDKAVEMKMQTEKYILGLGQPRFSPGVRSAFGPALGRGSLSAKNFM